MRLLARPEPPTALFVGTDECVKLYPLLAEMKIEVPETLSVAGFRMECDEAESGRDYSGIVQPTEQIGRRGVAALLDLAAGRCDHVFELLENAVNFGETVKRTY